MILGIVAGASRPVSVQALIVPHDTASPYVAAYPVTAAGFGAKYAAPVTVPTARCGSVVQSADKKTVYLSSVDALSPIAAYAWSASGFGAKRANPVETPKPSEGIAISSGGDIGVAHTAANGTFSVWATNPDGSIGAKYASPAAMISSTCWGGVGFNSDAFFAAVEDTPYIHAWAFTPGVGFGAKYATPASTPTGVSRGLAISSAAVIVGNNAAGGGAVRSYAWSSSGFGSVSLLSLSATPYGIGINKAATAVVVGSAGSASFSTSYTLSGSTIGAPINTIPYSLSIQGQGTNFNKDDSLVALSTNLTPFVTVANWDNTTGFGSKLAAPVPLPGGSARNANFVYT